MENGGKCINEFIKWMFRQKEWINRLIKEYFNEDLIMTKFMIIQTYLTYAKKN